RRIALPSADLHRRADLGLHDLVRDVLSVPLPDAVSPERARLLADPGGLAVPAPVVARIRDGADRRQALCAGAGAAPDRRRDGARRRRTAADARRDSV